MANVVKTKKPTKQAPKNKTKSSQESPWYVFCSQGCGFCKKAEPVIEELNNEGYNIVKLDVAEGDNQKLAQELKTEYGVQCGTPWFINAETGKGICGYREKDIIEKWLKGEDIPAPPRPNGPPPVPPLSPIVARDPPALGTIPVGPDGIKVVVGRIASAPPFSSVA